MCEVTIENFEKDYQELETRLRDARLIAIDLEFSSINATTKYQNSIFDSGEDRYKKLKATVEQMIPFQVGITPFAFNHDHSYVGYSYTFYVFPASFELFDKRFLCQTSSIQFLSLHGFDFNKLFNHGIPFLNTVQEKELSEYIKSNGTDFDSPRLTVFEEVLEEQGKIVAKWFFNAKDGDILDLNNVGNYKPNIIYMLHKTLRLRFPNRIWTYIDHEVFIVKKVDTITHKILLNKCNIDRHILDYMVGFTKVFRLLKSVKKPIIGHNLLFDLMVLIQNFEEPLPKSYTLFKKLVNATFPIIYDTKHISFNVYFSIPENKRWERSALENIYHYFKDGHGRHLALNSPVIECDSSVSLTFHSAGWDSFCTGYIFIRMAHIFAAQNYPNVRGKKFVPNELLNAVLQFKNKVNIIRGDTAYINLADNDPVSQRPPRFIIESVSSEPINIDHVTSLLSAYGFIEVKPLSHRGHRVIVAVDNFVSAKRILRQFPSHPEYRIQQYSLLKHSPVARSIFWCGVIVSSAALAWFGCLKLNKTK